MNFKGQDIGILTYNIKTKVFEKDNSIKDCQTDGLVFDNEHNLWLSCAIDSKPLNLDVNGSLYVKENGQNEWKRVRNDLVLANDMGYDSKRNRLLIPSFLKPSLKSYQIQEAKKDL